MKNFILTLIFAGLISGSASAQANPELSKALFDYQDCMRSSDNHLLMGGVAVAVSLPLMKSDRTRPYGLVLLSVAVIPIATGLLERRMAHGHIRTASIILNPSGAGVSVRF